jgi:hypothetical protein
MRLGQLARKLSLRPNEIVEFLANNNIQINDGSNTRIEDEHAMAVVRHFAPGSENFLKDEEEAEPVVVVTAEPVVEREEVEPVAEVSTETSVEETHVERKTEEETEQQEDGVIKAPKIELPGLKVIGKIELPEPKKKEPPVTTEEEPGTTTSTEGEAVPRDAREERRPHQRRERKELRPRKNPIAMQREREAQEDEKKKNVEKERDKERRTNNYYKKVKPAQPTKAARLVDEQVIEFHDKLEEKPKSLLTRFVHWFTGR